MTHQHLHLLLGLLPALACSEAPPATAKPEVDRRLREGIAARRHPSDGAGRAWIETESPDIEVSTAGKWSFTFEAGPQGIRSGGGIYFQVSPFWGWSTPQVTDSDASGFTTVSTKASDLELEPETIDTNLLYVSVSGRDMHAGERIRIVYGDGPKGAHSDLYAEQGSRFWFAVDGDGDGTREVLESSPAIRTLPSEPARLHMVVDSTARVGSEVELRISILDRMMNTGCSVDAEVELSLVPGSARSVELPESIVFNDSLPGKQLIRLRVDDPGIYRFSARTRVGDNELKAESNPLLVSSEGLRLWWGDLHGHSNFSDGTGLPAHYFEYAREIAGLDFVALTDHDHFGMLKLDQHPEMWEHIKSLVRGFHQPGEFVTLLGYEWTSWIHGHRHVIYFSDDGPLLSSLNDSSDTPQELWKGLEGLPAISVPHHPAGGPIAFNWRISMHPELEPVVELMSAHGSSESIDSPSLIYSAVPGNFARDALQRGYRFGFIASGDGHDGHPGTTHLGPLYGYRGLRGEQGFRLGNGGLVAVACPELTRDQVWRALRERRTYATNGPRIILQASLAGHGMGSTISAAALDEQSELTIRMVPTGEIEGIDIIRSGRTLSGSQPPSTGPDSSMGIFQTYVLEALEPGEFVYVRIRQKDGGLAWSSPFFVD